MQAFRGMVLFRIHDTKARRDEIARTNRYHPTAELQQDLVEAHACLERESERLFGDRLKLAMMEHATAQRLQDRLVKDLALFNADYQIELARAYAALDHAKRKQSRAMEAVDDAREQLAEASDAIERWHARANSRIPFYGKRGKGIPAHRFLAFSKADLASAQRSRDRAWIAFRAAEDDRDLARSEAAACRSRIGMMKSARSRRRQLIAAGQSSRSIRDDLDQSKQHIDRLSDAERALLKAKQNFFGTGPQALMIARIEAQIIEQDARRAEHLAIFDQPVMRERRRIRFSVQN